MNTARVPTAAWAVAIACFMTHLVIAQNPRSPSCAYVPPPVPDSVYLWIQGQNLTVYVDSTSRPDDLNRITILEIKWEGPGPGFVEENCDFENIYDGDFDVCTNRKIAKVRSRGIGPVFNLGEIIPLDWDVFDPGRQATLEWIVDFSFLTGFGMERDPPPCFVNCLPEPSAVTLLVLGAFGLVAARRRYPAEDRQMAGIPLLQ